MRKSGLQLLLSSMGLDINPEELKAKYEQAKDIMPKLAEFVNRLDERLAKIEETQAFIVTHIKGNIENEDKLNARRTSAN